MSTNKIDKRVIILLGFVIVLALIAKPVWNGREQSQFGQAYDDGIYMVTAKSLATGEGYRHVNIPGRPLATKYPPLYPFFLSLAWGITPDFPQTLWTASLLQDSLLPVYLAVLLLTLRQLGLSWRRTFLVTALTFVSFSFFFLTILLFSELLFGCFLLAAIYAVQRSVDRDLRWWAMLGGVLAGFAYLTRNAALPLFVAVPIFFFVRKRLRLSLFFFASAFPIAMAWHLWGAFHAQAGLRTPYLDEYLRAIRSSGLIAMLLGQLSELSTGVAEAFFPRVIEYLYGIPLHHLVLVAAIAGCIRLGWVRQWPLALIFTGLYMTMIACWRGGGGTRLFMPVWPVLLVGITEEMSHVASLCTRSIERSALKRAPRWAMIGLALYLIVRNDVVTWQRARSIYDSVRQDQSRDRKAYLWLSEHAKPGTVVLAWKDTVSYLYTGIPSSHDLFVATIPQAEMVTLRPSFSLPAGQFDTALLLLLDSDLGADSNESMDSFRASVKSVPGATLEYSSPGASVYRFPIQ